MMKRMILVALLALGGLAHADAERKKLCQDTIGMEKQRLGELERTKKWDVTALKEMEDIARARDKSSAYFEGREKEFTQIAGMTTGEDQKAFGDWAKGVEVYATHDKEIADQLRKIGAELKTQIEHIDIGIAAHKASIARLEPWCARVK
jgi:hypothetical protein